MPASYASLSPQRPADALPESGQSDTRGWVSSPEGQTLLHSFHNAPYPHVSGDKGYTYEGKFFDVDGHYSDSTVGISIPAGYQPGETVDYVVHLHG